MEHNFKGQSYFNMFSPSKFCILYIDTYNISEQVSVDVKIFKDIKNEFPVFFFLSSFLVGIVEIYLIINNIAKIVVLNKKF